MRFDLLENVVESNVLRCQIRAVLVRMPELKMIELADDEDGVGDAGARKEIRRNQYAMMAVHLARPRLARNQSAVVTSRPAPGQRSQNLHSSRPLILGIRLETLVGAGMDHEGAVG